MLYEEKHQEMCPPLSLYFTIHFCSLTFAVIVHRLSFKQAKEEAMSKSFF